MNEKELDISSKFTMDDIHKIREYNYEVTKDMTFDEQRLYYNKGAEEFLKLIIESRGVLNNKEVQNVLYRN